MRDVLSIGTHLRLVPVKVNAIEHVAEAATEAGTLFIDVQDFDIPPEPQASGWSHDELIN